jgi:hypothetical protein
MAFVDNHSFPHHSSIPYSISSLINFVSTIQNELDNTFKENSPRKILYYFAYAAFAQYHFVDIHPFVDGNGRMCRFISKFLLDPICPLPVPMFEDRNTYINTLKGGRNLPAKAAPSLLLELLLNSALHFYTDIIKRYRNNEETVYIIFEEDEIPTEVLKNSYTINIDHYDKLKVDV